MKNIMTLFGSIAAAAFIIIAPNAASAAIDPARPLILIPTTLGTLPSEHGPVLDPIFGTYENFIQTFTDSGYELGADLFVLEYDWQEPLGDTSAELANLISAIKTDTGAAEVDIVGHGQGGLIAWHHITSASYQGDVSALALLGAPATGIPAAYTGWEGGEFHLHASSVGRGFGQALLDAHANTAGQSTYAYIQNNAQAFRDLLPPSAFPYLNAAPPANPFLENLLGNFPHFVGPQVATIVGKDKVTVGGYEVVPAPGAHPLWQHGEPVSTVPAALGGDGLVNFESVTTLFGGDPSFFDYAPSAAHHELPTQMQEEIFSFINGVEPDSPSTEPVSISCTLFVTTSSGTDMTITGPGGEELGDGVNDFERAFYSGSGYDTEYAVIANPGVDLFGVAVSGNAGESFTVDALEICEGITRAGSITEIIPEDGAVELDIEIAAEGVTVVVAPDAPTDAGAPTVTITSPTDSETYLSTEEVFATATVEDPEGSAITSTEYLFNDEAIDPADPLPLGDAPAGIATLEVRATDEFGNTGSSSILFFIAEPPPPPPPAGSTGCLFVLNPSTQNALQLVGSAKVLADGCPVQVSSGATPAVSLAGSAKVTSSKNCVAGTLKRAGSASMSPSPDDECGAVADPFAGYAKPEVGSCTHTNRSIAGSQSATLSPGTYCGGITIAGSAKVTLLPGTYVLSGGNLSVAGSARVTGTDVSLFMTGSGAGFSVAGSGKVELKAPATGPLAGIAIFLDSSTESGIPAAASQLAGSASLQAEGAVYLPNQKLTLAGSAKILPTPFTAVLADTVSLVGSAQMNLRIQPSASSVPVPPGL